MKITDVRAYAIRKKVEHPFVWRWGLPGSGSETEFTVLRILTDEGFEGICTVPRGAITVDLVKRRIKDMLIGRDPLLKEEIWHQMWELDRVEEFPIYILGCVDVALWDLTAKVASLPLYKLLGGYVNRVPAYASTVTYDSIEQYLHVADQCLDRGFKAIKLHAWGDVNKDAELAKELRKHVGDGIELMYDGSGGFNFEQSVRLGRQLEECGFAWYEEPMREFSITSYQRLCQELDIPILAAETSDGCHYNAADFIVNRAVDVVRTSSQFKGGITGALRIAHLADSFGMNAEVHGIEMPNLHLACAIPNNSYFEVLVADEPIVLAHEIGLDGCVSPPDVPGIGEEYDWEELEASAFLKV